MPTPTRTYANADHAVIVADVTALCRMKHGPASAPALLVFLRTTTPPCPVTFDFHDDAECVAFYQGLVAAMG